MSDVAKTVLTLEALAERWSVTPDELRRRFKKLRLPAVNVGTEKNPDYRFRLAAIERWEADNEGTVGDPAKEGAAVPTGAPPGLEGYDAFRPKPRKGSRRGA